MRLRALGVLTVVAAAATSAASASAAEIRVDRGCYADPKDRADTVQLSGTGFTPNAAYQVTLDGQPLAGGSGRIDASGAMSGSFGAPRVALSSRIARQHVFRIGVQEGANAPETTFTVSRLYASFRPTAGTLSTLKVRFSVYGFALQGDAKAPVYLHYVRPGGKLERTYRLGTAGGACGFERSSRRRLFPFAARRGLWRLQFDTQKAYSRGGKDSTFLFSAVAVTVR